MYKIYINDTPLYLKAFEDYHPSTDSHLTCIYMNKPRVLLQYIDTLEKNRNYEAVSIFARDFKKLKDDFLNLYKIVEAAGGLVFNESGKLLVIYRRNNWDLPKGKIDEGETLKEAAVREVMEETGLKEVYLKEKIGITLHTYKNRLGKRRIKKSHWYRMEAPMQTTLPQIEEDIELVDWVSPQHFLDNFSPIYSNIEEIINAFLKK